MRRFAGIAALLAAAVLGGCGTAQPDADVDHLVLYSPHSDEVEQEFTEGFKAWYREQTGRTVRLAWPDAGGTTQLLKRIQDKFARGRYDVDIVFGGGPIFERMKQMGFLAPYRLPDEVLAALPRKVAGQLLYDPEHHWYGAAISTFGLIYNKTVIRERNLPPVEAWDVMAEPRYFGRVGAGDASKSGSVRKAYEIILQAYGYERGMAILVGMAANAREFYAASSEIPRNCAQGFVAVGPCIDFYAQRQMRSEGGEHLGFVAPEGLTAVNCDPVGILKNAPHRRVAERFVEFVMRPEGQRLWMLEPGTPGGPRQFAIQRLAALPSIYEELQSAGGTPPMNPFTLPAADFYDAEKEYDRLAILPDYLRVALVENHEPLKKAWAAIIRSGTPVQHLANRLVEPLISERRMRRLGREVWTPVVIPEDASPEKRAELKRREEQRLREKIRLEAEWSKALRARYETLAAEADAMTSP